MFYNFIVWLYDNWRFGGYYSFLCFFSVPGVENQFARGTWASSCWKDNINDKKKLEKKVLGLCIKIGNFGVGGYFTCSAIALFCDTTVRTALF